MIETTTPAAQFDIIPDPFQPETITVEARLLSQINLMQDQITCLLFDKERVDSDNTVRITNAIQNLTNQQGDYRDMITRLERAVEGLTTENKSLNAKLSAKIAEDQLGSGDSDKVVRLRKHIIELNALLADKKTKPAEEGGFEGMSLDAINRLTGDRKTAAMSHYIMKNSLREKKVESTTKDPETTSKKISTKPTRNTVTVDNLPAELPDLPKSKRQELYDAVSKYEDPILRSHAVLLCQESKDKLTPQQLRDSMKIAVLIFNEYNGKMPPQLLQELIRKNTQSTSRSTKNKEILPEVPDAVSEFINDLKSKTSCDPRTLSEDKKQLYKRNRNLLKIAYDLSGEKTFLDGNNANISCIDFSIKVQRRYDWEMDTGKAMKDTIVGGINTVIGKLPFFPQKQEKDSKTNNQGLVIELVEGTFLPLETVEHFAKRLADKDKFDESRKNIVGSPITHKSTIETLGTNTPISEDSIVTNTQPNSKPLGSKSATPEKLSNQEVEAIRTTIKNRCEQFISILNMMNNGGNNDLGFRRLLEFSTRDNSTKFLKNISNQLQKTVDNYNLTPDNEKLNFLAKSNAEILASLEKLSYESKNGNGVKKYP